MDSGSQNYERYLAGDDGGMEDIIREYRDNLIFFLSGFVGSLAAAEDAAEDTFVLLCTKKPKDRQKSSFKTWLYTIARNLAVSELRKRGRHSVIPLEADETDDDPAEESAADAYFKEEEKRTLYRAMKALKAEYRQVLWLAYFEELSYAEIAKIFKKSVHNVEVLASRARQALKKELIKEGFDDENYR